MRWAVALVLFLLLAAGGLAIVRHKRTTPAAQRFVLSNGALLSYEGITYGTNHISPGGPASWLRFVPAPLRKPFSRAGVTTFTVNDPVAVVWFSRVGPTSPGGTEWQCTVVMDDGFESPCSGTTYFGGSATNRMEGRSMPVSRRSKTLRLRIYENAWGSNTRVLGEFTVRNPAPLSTQRWTARDLPQTDTNDDLTVSLLNLTTAGVISNQLHRGRSRAEFEVRQAGQFTTNWHVQRIQSTDATGNILSPNSWGGPNGKTQAFEFSPPLWPSEVYKLRVELSRTASAAYASNELWVIPKIAVPTNGGFTKVEATNTLNGYYLCLHGLSTENSVTPWRSLMAAPRRLDFDVMPKPVDHRFTLVRMEDDQGRPISEESRGWSDTNYSIGLRISNDVRFINVIVAMPKSRYVDFIAQPTIATNR